MQFTKLFGAKQRYGDEQQEEKLLAEEQSAQEVRFRAGSRGRAHNTFFYTSFALLNICAGLLIGYWCKGFSETSLASFGINPNTPIPLEIFTSRHDVPFSPNPQYMGPGHEVNKNWAKLTEGQDSIFLPDPESYGLKDPGIHAPFFIFTEPPASAAALDNINNFFVLNNLHQLHCVNMIRKRYNSLVYEPETNPLSGTPIDSDWITHLEHCFEYLRLSITCGDYMAFETDSPPGSPEEYWKDGLSWGVVHSCMDWDALMKWQERQVVLYNSTWN
ncbi:hypothetical protein MPH_00046 [Macrophomina phaseolina MS6]|uniref:Tat pathway signal sequence n=1 Tax=Macrophomina phaseolina (strain MS6) TaxID=1126212 RepID=K2S6V8_MACPH|nr:hypothetical protein MPH_00046 [Macrophomina phaseolina MS6]